MITDDMIEFRSLRQRVCSIPTMLIMSSEDRTGSISTTSDLALSTPGMEEDKSAAPIMMDTLEGDKTVSSDDHIDRTIGSMTILEEEEEEGEDDQEYGSKGWAFYLAFLSICLSSFLSALDLTTVSTALPTIVANLPVNLEHAHHHHHHLFNVNVTSSNLLSQNATFCGELLSQGNQGGQGGSFIWIGTAYALAGTAIMPWMGTLAQIWGRKHLYTGSIIIFAIGSAICGSAPSLNILILGRVIQGIGDGGIISLSEILIADLVPLAERGTWEGLLGAVWAIASALGPPIGGALSKNDHWRWLFYLNLPLCLISLVLVFFFLVNRSPKASIRDKLARMDWFGNITVIASLCCITLALTWGGTRFSWISAPVLVTVILGSLLFVGFFVYEFRFAKNPTIPPAVLSTPSGKGAYMSTFLHGLVSMAVIYLLPSYFQACLLASPARSGIMILPLALTIAPFAILGAVVIEITERYIVINYMGWILSILGLALFTLLDSNPHEWLWILVQIPLGIGLGFLFVSPQFPILAAVSPQLAAHALGTYTFVSSLGQTFGIAVGDAVLQGSVTPLLGKICKQDVTSTLGAVRGIRLLPAALRQRIIEAYAQGFRDAWISLLPFAIIGLLTCLALRTTKLHTDLDQDYFALADHHRPQPRVAEQSLESPTPPTLTDETQQ